MITKMIISNRRDVGYTIISRFEENFRLLLNNFLNRKYDSFYIYIPKGIVQKAKDRNNGDFESSLDFFENIDFPDLKEITIFKDHFKLLINEGFSKDDFILYMDQLYDLRCKIAHIKGSFSSIDLEKLIEFTEILSKKLQLKIILDLIDNLKENTNSDFLLTVPTDFYIDTYNKIGIINNLPTPDYEYDGGFVGRDEDRKKIIQYLSSPKFPVVTITGSGGVGKTALSLRIIQDILEEGNKLNLDTIVWLSAKENKLSDLGIEDIEPSLKDFEELLNIIIDMFDLPILDSIEEKIISVNKIFEINEKILIVVDNLETITDQRIINFIYDAPLNVKFLITSRKGLGQIERRHELRELKQKEAVYLFRQIAKDKGLIKLSQLKDEIISKYVEKVSNYPLAIKWVVGQVARGKDINSIIDKINTSDSDISKFCFDEIYSSLNENSQKILLTLSLVEKIPTATVLQYVVELNEDDFEDAIEELILSSLVIPEQYQNDNNEISTKYSLLPLTKSFIRIQASKTLDLREKLKYRINEVEHTITASEIAKKEYKHSLYNYGAKTDEEKVATIIAQNAFQKYQNDDYEGALEEYKRAIKTAPNFAPVYRNWALMEAYEDHLSEADSLMEKAATLDKHDPQIFLIWGNIKRKSTRHIDALSKYKIAHDLSPEDPIILNAYGQAQCRLGNYEEAEDLLSKALESKFDSIKHNVICKTSLAENYVNWGDSLYKNKNYKDAEDKYNEALRNCFSAISDNSKDPKIYNVLNKSNLRKGTMLLERKEYPKAIEALSNVANSQAYTNKQLSYKLNSLLNLAEHYINSNDEIQFKRYMGRIHREFKGTPQIKYPNFNDRYTILQENLDLENLKYGKISRINAEKGFAIITENETDETYLGHRSKFIPKIEILFDSIINKDVVFKKLESDFDKMHAYNIRFL